MRSCYVGAGRAGKFCKEGKREMRNIAIACILIGLALVSPAMSAPNNNPEKTIPANPKTMGPVGQDLERRTSGLPQASAQRPKQFWGDCNNPNSMGAMGGQDLRLNACLQQILQEDFWKLEMGKAQAEAYGRLGVIDGQNSTPPPEPMSSQTPTPPKAPEPTPSPTATPDTHGELFRQDMHLAPGAKFWSENAVAAVTDYGRAAPDQPVYQTEDTPEQPPAGPNFDAQSPGEILTFPTPTPTN